MKEGIKGVPCDPFSKRLSLFSNDFLLDELEGRLHLLGGDEELVLVERLEFADLLHQGARVPMNAAWMRLKSNEHTLSRMALMGDRVPGPELLRLGVAHEVVPDVEVLPRAKVLAARFAGFPPMSARNIKRDITAHRGVDPDSWFADVASSALLSAKQIRR